MNTAIFLLLILNFSCIGLLPAMFFKRDGRLNGMWWLTAAPFFFSPALLAAATLGYLHPLFTSEGMWAPFFELGAVMLSFGSIAFIFFTLGTHRVPLALWHQENDAPRNIVTYGAYRRVRHPFYSSFLLALAAVFLFFPHLGTLGAFLHGLIILNFSAGREESRLSASEFGDEYQKYMHQTGRFLPKLGGQAS